MSTESENLKPQECKGDGPIEDTLESVIRELEMDVVRKLKRRDVIIDVPASSSGGGANLYSVREDERDILIVELAGVPVAEFPRLNVDVNVESGGEHTIIDHGTYDWDEKHS